MSKPPPNSSNQSAESSIKGILEWLALAHGRNGNEDTEQLHQQLQTLRAAAVPTAQRQKLLDLLFSQAERIVNTDLLALREISLPVSRKLRQRIRATLEMLGTLTQDYFNTLADLFDPHNTVSPRPPQGALRRVMLCLNWQIQISYLVASPTILGVWQQLHAAFRTAQRLGLSHSAPVRDGLSISQIYTNALLAAIAQPASFSSRELSFINSYIAVCNHALELSSEPDPIKGDNSIFWIDLDKDAPAHALIRRLPSAESPTLYFSCAAVTELAMHHLRELRSGATASSLGLPAFAETRTGKAVLKRLVELWGRPAKRKFPRRRQSYRVHFCAGLESLWQLMKHPESTTALSEWMVTNESPDGYALMHMSGHTRNLEVGDIAALQPIGERAEAVPLWHVCIVRWALSENPEHIELGLQLLASRAVAAEIAQPFDLDSPSISALILPETPPLRPSQALIVPTGALGDAKHKIIVLVESDNLAIREVRTTSIEEQTSSIEVFSVSPDETP
ncbi:MAG: hypothetical protein D3M94_08940 [Rhodocyclales bacterium GT-UBC]|nr:MAG: hypothetical protein D3M94_08940 [Rhodocyclales bacterium GT-UBC]